MTAKPAVVAQRLRTLEVRLPDGRLDSLSAASGLVKIGPFLYVIADDELGLAQFRLDSAEPGQLLPLLPGQLPEAASERKRHKPDWEALLQLPGSATWPNGALLVFGSGSRPNRQLACIVPLGPEGDWLGRVERFDLSGFYQQLKPWTADLNIEAAFCRGDELLLVSRGNRRQPHSWLFRCPLQAWLDGLVGKTAVLPAVTALPLELPVLAGVPAAISDAVAVDDGWLATAIAEATDDAYQDGACVGAAFALFDVEHRLQAWWPLTEPIKFEGVAVEPTQTGWRLLLVNDPDDRAIAAGLYEVFLANPENSPSR